MKIQSSLFHGSSSTLATFVRDGSIFTIHAQDTIIDSVLTKREYMFFATGGSDTSLETVRELIATQDTVSQAHILHAVESVLAQWAGEWIDLSKMFGSVIIRIDWEQVAGSYDLMTDGEKAEYNNSRLGR